MFASALHTLHTLVSSMEGKKKKHATNRPESEESVVVVGGGWGVGNWVPRL